SLHKYHKFLLVFVSYSSFFPSICSYSIDISYLFFSFFSFPHWYPTWLLISLTPIILVWYCDTEGKKGAVVSKDSTLCLYRLNDRKSCLIVIPHYFLIHLV